ncbi:MAG: restriction endonuclease [Rhodospirillales bacterium]|jgi:restriction system protein|nr:restriction endonuclease [Rhodospirillales bacterium]
MSIPDFQSLMLPVLRFAANGETSVGDCIEALAGEFKLTEEERERLLPSGKQAIFSNRVHWAKFYLVKAGLLQATRRAHFQASQRGLDVLSTHPPRINIAFLRQYPEFLQFHGGIAPARDAGKVEPLAETGAVLDAATPVERIEAAFEEVNVALRESLLDRIMQATPKFFEGLIVDLMIAMGYGGSRPEAGKRLGRSGDGGIDGLINEDILGLDSIYLQAKRYAPGNVIGVEKVREFAGSLVERGATKGVFVTTSSFAAGAAVYVERIPQKLVLIDGEELTRLMIRYDVGVRVTRRIDLKAEDLDYFDEDDGT